MKPLVYLDTNIFIAAFETTGARCDHAWWVLGAAEKDDIHVATSGLTLAELLSKPPPDNPRLAESYLDIIRDRSGFKVLPVSRLVLLEAAAVRRGVGSIKRPDAIHLASATVGACTHILTSDQRFRSAGRKIVQFSPHSLDEILAETS